MRIIVDSPKYFRVIFKYIDKIFEGGFIGNKEDSKFFLDSEKKVLAEYNKKHNKVYISAYQLWLKFGKIFRINDRDLIDVFKKWFQNKIGFFKKIFGFSIGPALPPTEQDWINIQFNDLKPI
jgi:hypothetical protein